jgi:hypothetical protein
MAWLGESIVTKTIELNVLRPGDAGRIVFSRHFFSVKPREDRQI